MTVSEYIAKFIVKNNIKHVFGYPGNAIIDLIEKIISTNKIQYIQNYHEQASAFCADAYSRLSDNFGVALATSGPGATNLITGIINAQLDSIPTLFITGQDHSARVTSKKNCRSNGFQDLDIVSMVKPIIKYAIRIKDPLTIAFELEKCIFYCKNGRPGAVLIDIPYDIFFKKIKTSSFHHFVFKKNTTTPSAKKLKEFISLLYKSKRPLILAGGGVRLSKSIKLLNEFSRLTNIPIVSTLNGLDITAKAFGFSGLYGNQYANNALFNADLIIVMGSRLGHHQVVNRYDYTSAKIIHIDIDSNELSRLFKKELIINSELSIFLSQIIPYVRNHKISNYNNWIGILNKLKENYKKVQSKDNLIENLIEEVQKNTNTKAVFTLDVGKNQMWCAQFIRIRDGQRMLTSSALGSMGYSLPAAIASKIFNPKSDVIAFMGDGGFQMNMQELQLINLKKINIKIIIFNNNSLGLIKDTEEKYYGKNEFICIKPNFGCPNLKFISSAYNLQYLKINNKSDFKHLNKFLTNNRACIIEVIINPKLILNTRKNYKINFASAC